MRDVNIATIGRGRMEHVENLLNAESSIDLLVNTTTLRKDDFESIQAGIKELQELYLVGVNDLRAAGLTTSASVTDMIITKEYELDFSDASSGLEYAPMGDDEARFGFTSTPNPVMWKDFSVAWRQEGFDYKANIGRNRAMRKVMEKYNNTIFLGDSSIVINHEGTNRPLYGYTNHPNRATETISDWTAATTNLLANVRSMLDEMYNTNKISPATGSIMTYVATDLWILLTEDAFSAKGDRSFREQILFRHPEIRDIKPAPGLTSKNVVMVMMDSMYVELAEAQAPVVIPHVKNVAIAPARWTAYAVGALLIHVDANGLTGIVHGAP